MCDNPLSNHEGGQSLKRINRTIVTVLFLASTTPAWALFDGQILVGQRNSKVDVSDKTENVSGKDIYLGVHVDPIAVAPVAFGFYYLMQDYKLDANSENFPGSYLKGNQIGAELSAWLPFDIYNLVPFVKLGYSFYGKAQSKTEDVPIYIFESDASESELADLDVDYGITGTHFGIGLRWEPIAIVAGVIEFDMGKEKYTAKKVNIGSYSRDENLSDFDLAVSSMAIRIGIQAGI